MNLEACGITDVGCVRTNNEDNFVCDVGRRLFVVCDGMGGHAAGEVASLLACQLITAQVDALRKDMPTTAFPWRTEAAQKLVDTMQQGMARISRAIVDAGVAEGQKKGMGTTCTAVWLVDGQHALVAHIGDSRLYLSSPFDGGAVTTDHTLVEELVARGLIGPEEARRHPQAHILARALGASSGIEGDCFMMRVGPGDSLLLCSDGLHAYLPDAVNLGPPWHAGQSTHGPPPITAPEQTTLTQALQQLIAQAKARGGHDNLTGVLVHLQDASHSERATAAEPLAQTLNLLAQHPALGALPPLLLRRIACAVVPVPPQQEVANTGIFWAAAHPLTALTPNGPQPLLGASWHAPHPLGPWNGPQGHTPHKISCAGTMWHLPADALVLACRACPSLGARVLGGLLQDAALQPNGAPADTAPTGAVDQLSGQALGRRS